jgi:copper chaperone CopZ
MSILCAAILALAPALEVEQVKHRITGLFDRLREADLRESVKKMTGVTLVSIDFDHAEATFEYDAAKLFKDSKPKDYLERFDSLLRQSSAHTFGARPLSTTPKDKLTRIEIPVAGNDCKGCCLAAYESIFKIDGVEQATASFKEGKVTALIDPSKTNRAALEEALKKRQVVLPSK